MQTPTQNILAGHESLNKSLKRLEHEARDSASVADLRRVLSTLIGIIREEIDPPKNGVDNSR